MDKSWRDATLVIAVPTLGDPVFRGLVRTYWTISSRNDMKATRNSRGPTPHRRPGLPGLDSFTVYGADLQVNRAFFLRFGNGFEHRHQRLTL